MRRKESLDAVDSVPLLSLVVVWRSIGTAFSLLPAVASRDGYKLVPHVPTDSLLGFCHCWGDAEPGTGVFSWGDWQPMVCRSEMTWGLILLAVAHLSATSESRKIPKNKYNPCIQRQAALCG